MLRDTQDNQTPYFSPPILPQIPDNLLVRRMPQKSPQDIPTQKGGKAKVSGDNARFYCGWEVMAYPIRRNDRHRKFHYDYV